MSKSPFPLFLALWVSAPFAGTAIAQHSHYVGQETREIKSLAPAEVNDLLAGRGMGLARAAELNGYPGPMHVLELAAKLELSEAQVRSTQDIFTRMQAQAQALGAQLVDAERDLDTLFRQRRADPDAVTARLNTIAQLQAAVRGTHLQAHIEQLSVLTPQQITQYMQLRGYGAANAAQGHRHHH